MLKENLSFKKTFKVEADLETINNALPKKWNNFGLNKIYSEEFNRKFKDYDEFVNGVCTICGKTE